LVYVDDCLSAKFTHYDSECILLFHPNYDQPVIAENTTCFASSYLERNVSKCFAVKQIANRTYTDESESFSAALHGVNVLESEHKYNMRKQANRQAEPNNIPKQTRNTK
jgi:hypothetical protein